MGTVLVTGGSGFIGSYVLRILAERGDTVINFDTQPPRPEAEWWLSGVQSKITFVQGGIDNWSDVVGIMNKYRPDKIIHMAAIGSPVVLKQRPALALNVNIQGSFNVLEVARLFDVKRVVYFSSIGVLPSVQYEPMDNKHPVLLGTEGPGASFYGASKIAGEALCWAYNQSFGLDFIVVRPSAVYGFGMFLPIYIKPMIEDSVRGEPVRFPNGRDFPRDYTHVEDVAQLTVQALDVAADKVKDRVFYAATGEPLVTAGQVAEMVEELLPDAEIEVGEGLSEDDLVEIRYRGQLSIANAQEQLGYKPKYAHIRDGIEQYIEMYTKYMNELA